MSILFVLKTFFSHKNSVKNKKKLQILNLPFAKKIRLKLRMRRLKNLRFKLN